MWIDPLELHFLDKIIRSIQVYDLPLYSNMNRSKGLEILAFPCNQFGKQEPGTADEIKNFCASKYNVKFPLFSKIDVNGPNTHDVYKFLRVNSDMFDHSKKVAKPIQWNFHIFLVGDDGNVAKSYPPSHELGAVEEDLKKIFG